MKFTELQRIQIRVALSTPCTAVEFAEDDTVFCMSDLPEPMFAGTVCGTFARMSWVGAVDVSKVNFHGKEMYLLTIYTKGELEDMKPFLVVSMLKGAKFNFLVRAVVDWRARIAIEAFGLGKVQSIRTMSEQEVKMLDVNFNGLLPGVAVPLGPLCNEKEI